MQQRKSAAKKKLSERVRMLSEILTRGNLAAFVANSLMNRRGDEHIKSPEVTFRSN